MAFQAAQRDIFDVLAHSLGSATPGQYLQDFWLALPSLRALLAFDEGWKNAQEEMWAILLEAFMRASSHPRGLVGNGIDFPQRRTYSASPPLLSQLVPSSMAALMFLSSGTKSSYTPRAPPHRSAGRARARETSCGRTATRTSGRRQRRRFRGLRWTCRNYWGILRFVFHIQARKGTDFMVDQADVRYCRYWLRSAP